MTVTNPVPSKAATNPARPELRRDLTGLWANRKGAKP